MVFIMMSSVQIMAYHVSIVCLYLCKLCMDICDQWCFKSVNLMRCSDIWIWGMLRLLLNVKDICSASKYTDEVLICTEEWLILCLPGIWVYFHGVCSSWWPCSCFRGQEHLAIIMYLIWPILPQCFGIDRLTCWRDYDSPVGALS